MVTVGGREAVVVMVQGGGKRIWWDSGEGKHEGSDYPSSSPSLTPSTSGLLIFVTNVIKVFQQIS